MCAIKRAALGLALSVCLFAWQVPARADTITYSITADTSSVYGQTALAASYNGVSFQLTSGGDVDSDSAVINSFTSDGSAGAGLMTVGDVTGNLLSLPLTINDDDGALADGLLQDFTYGNSIQFLLTLTTYPPGPDGVTFYFAMYDQNGNAIDPGANGIFAGIINVNADGTQSVVDTGSGVTIVPYNGPPAVPEPPSFVLLALGIVGIAGNAWRRKGSRPPG
jgi:hypothetical protein